MLDFKRYGWNLLIVLDEVGNTLTFGDPQETISSRAAKAKANKRVWGCVLCRFLDLFQKGHCDKAIDNNVGSRAVIADGL